MYCPKCGAQNEGGLACTACGEPLPQIPRPKDSYDDGLSYIIPINHSGWAIAASYAGLFAVLVVFAPVALVFGLLALRDLKRNPKKKGKGRAMFGLVMGIVFTAVPIVIGVGVLISKLLKH